MEDLIIKLFSGREHFVFFLLVIITASLFLVGFEYKHFKFHGLFKSIKNLFHKTNFSDCPPYVKIERNKITYSGAFLLCEDSSQINMEGPRNYIKRLSEDTDDTNNFIVFDFLKADAIISRILGLIIEVSKYKNIKIKLIIKEKHFDDIGVIYRSPADYQNIEYEVIKDGV